jgi:hypothetical protein
MNDQQLFGPCREARHGDCTGFHTLPGYGTERCACPCHSVPPVPGYRALPVDGGANQGIYTEDREPRRGDCY